MGFLSRILGRSDAKAGDRVQVHGHISPEGLSFDEARALQDEANAMLSATDAESKFRAANKLMLGQQYKEAIAMFEAIIAQHADRRGDCEGNIGACCYFLGQFEQAIEHYQAAIAHGADPELMQDNIDEAREALG